MAFITSLDKSSHHLCQNVAYERKNIIFCARFFSLCHKLAQLIINFAVEYKTKKYYGRKPLSEICVVA